MSDEPKQVTVEVPGAIRILVGFGYVGLLTWSTFTTSSAWLMWLSAIAALWLLIGLLLNRD